MRMNVVWGINEINDHVIVFYCEEITNKRVGQICIETYSLYLVSFLFLFL